MLLWKRALAPGLLSWLIPFAAGFALFPLKSSNAALFETLMTLAVLLTAGLLLRIYFRSRTATVHEAAAVGALWMAVNLALDYPMFAFGPMKMTAARYYSEIGLDYLIYPLFALFAARLAQSPRSARAA